MNMFNKKQLWNMVEASTNGSSSVRTLKLPNLGTRMPHPRMPSCLANELGKANCLTSHWGTVTLPDLAFCLGFLRPVKSHETRSFFSCFIFAARFQCTSYCALSLALLGLVESTFHWSTVHAKSGETRSHPNSCSQQGLQQQTSSKAVDKL